MVVTKTSSAVQVSSSVVSTTAQLVHSSSVVYQELQSYSTELGVPSAKGNPFLASSSFKQGTFYVIVGPIVGGLVVLYLMSALIRRIQARRNAKGLELEEYDMNQSMVDPFERGDYEENGSFYYNGYGSKSVLDLDTSSGNPYGSLSVLGSVSGPLGPTDTVSTLHEPVKTAQPPVTSHRTHKRRTSSMALDDFIATGALPELEGEHRLDPRQVETHSMYQSPDNSYLAGSREASPVRFSRSRSPVRRS